MYAVEFLLLREIRLSFLKPVFCFVSTGTKALKDKTSKAERRAKQEAERAAKLAMKEVGENLKHRMYIRAYVCVTANVEDLK